MDVQHARDAIEPLLRDDVRTRGDLNEAIKAAVQGRMRDLLPILVRSQTQASWAQMMFARFTDGTDEELEMLLYDLASKYRPGVANPVFFAATGVPVPRIRLTIASETQRRGECAAAAAHVSDVP